MPSSSPVAQLSSDERVDARVEAASPSKSLSVVPKTQELRQSMGPKGCENLGVTTSGGKVASEVSEAPTQSNREPPHLSLSSRKCKWCPHSD